MTKSLARELASRHITVNAVAPGMIETDMTGAMSDAVKEKVVENVEGGSTPPQTPDGALAGSGGV